MLVGFALFRQVFICVWCAGGDYWGCCIEVERMEDYNVLLILLNNRKELDDVVGTNFAAGCAAGNPIAP